MVIVDNMPEGRTGRPPQHPWDEWADGQIHSLVQGKDFQATVTGFRGLVHHTAAARNMKAKTRIRGNTITIQFIAK